MLGIISLKPRFSGGSVSRLSVRLLPEDLDMCKTTAHKIICERLNMRKVCAKLVPKVLIDEQKGGRVDVFREMSEQLESESNFLDNVIIRAESWVFQFNPETKCQCSE